jgi:hypothetical protein
MAIHKGLMFVLSSYFLMNFRNTFIDFYIMRLEIIPDECEYDLLDSCKNTYPLDVVSACLSSNLRSDLINSFADNAIPCNQPHIASETFKKLTKKSFYTRKNPETAKQTTYWRRNLSTPLLKLSVN